MSKDCKATWSCPQGCSLSAKACEHLEELLPHPLTGERTRSQISLYYIGEYPDFLPQRLAEETAEGSKAGFESWLKQFPLAPYQVALLLDRFCYGETLSQIKKTWGCSDTRVIRQIIQESLEIIEEHLAQGVK